MSGEIKFRFYCPGHGITKGISLQELLREADVITSDGTNIIGSISNDPMISIMRFTGLYDATTWEELTENERSQWTRGGNMSSEWKGKEIYEGDIIDTFDYMGICVVHFISGCFVIENSKDSDLLGWPSIAQADSRYDTLCRGARGYKVIDNIHINPELLTVY